MREVSARLDTGSPLDLLAEVSTLIAALAPPHTPFQRGGQAKAEIPSLGEMVESLAGADRLETTAILAGFAHLAPDELLRARARRAVAGRSHPLPGWLARLGRAQPGRVMEMVHVLRDGDNVMVEVHLSNPDGLATGDTVQALSVVVYIDHNLGSVVKDAFVVPGSLDDLVGVMKSHADTEDLQWRDLDPAAARARILEGVEHGAIMFPPLESDTWPACRPLVEWAARLLPEGGNGYERPEWDEESRSEVTAAFFASPQGQPVDRAAHRQLFEPMLWFATDYGPGDPLHWSPTSVEILLTDWIPRKIVAPPEFLAGAPEVLRAFIAYAHAQRGIRPGLTTETLEAVDRWEPEYQETIRTARPQGPAALLAAIGALDPDGPWEMADQFDEPYDPAQALLDSLRSAVGGNDALWALDSLPLPDEAFAWEGIDTDIQARVADVLGRCDRFCDDRLDDEYRTACRRFLARVARNDAEVFRRRGRVETAAAAICWSIGKANEAFTPPASGGGMLVKDLVAYFGLAQGSVSQRAATMIRAAGVAPSQGYYAAWGVDLGDPNLLVSERRRRIIDNRDLIPETC